MIMKEDINWIGCFPHLSMGFSQDRWIRTIFGTRDIPSIQWIKKKRDYEAQRKNKKIYLIGDPR